MLEQMSNDIFYMIVEKKKKSFLQNINTMYSQTTRETVEKLALLGPREDKETMARTVVMEPQGRGETPVCR